MNIEPSGQLRQGPFALDRSQCHFGFKCRRMIAAGSLRHGSPSFQAISSPVMNGVATYPVVLKSGSSSDPGGSICRGVAGDRGATAARWGAASEDGVGGAEPATRRAVQRRTAAHPAEAVLGVA